MDKNKKNILFVVEAFGGGVFTYLVDMANKLSEKYNVTVAYGLRPQTPNDFGSFFKNNIVFYEVKNFGRNINLLKELHAFLEIKKIAKQVKPDIIHLHSSKAGLLGRFAFNGKKVSLFYTPHGYSFLMMDQSGLKRSIYKLIEKIAAKRKCTTISCSKGEHTETLALTQNAVYVNNGINTAALEKECSYTYSSKKKEQPSVFTIGRICCQKNPELFNRIATKFKDVQFTWIGDGELKDTLKSENILKTGWMERNEVLKKAANADIFILTSLWEGLPISLLEAMFMKKICIVSDVVGNRDVIKNGYNGFLCKNEEDFISALKEALESDCRVLRENAYKDVMNVYNTDVMVGEYDKIYQKSLKNNA